MRWIKQYQALKQEPKECEYPRYEQYKTTESKLAFCDSLLKLADKLFFAPFVPLLTLSFADTSPWLFLLQLALATVAFFFGLCLRGDALRKIDQIYANSIANAEA